MKILITVSDSCWGGKHTQYAEWVEFLSRFGCSLYICAERDGLFAGKMLEGGYPVFPVKSFESYAEEDSRYIEKMIKEYEIEYLVVTGRRDSHFIASLYKRLEEKPFFIFSRGSAFPISVNEKSSELFKALDAVVIMSEQQIEQQMRPFIDAGLLDEERIFLFNTTVNTARFSPKGRNRKLAEMWEIADEDFVVANVARLSWEKDHDTLLKAFSLVHSRYDNWKLLIVGGGERLEELEELSRTLGIASKVCFTGHREDMPDVYSLFDCFVFTSICEETGAISLQEAMSMEIPVIAPTCGVIPSYVKEHETGFLFTPQDSDELATIFDSIAREQELVKKIAYNGRKEMQNRFDTGVNINRFYKYLSELKMVSKVGG